VTRDNFDSRVTVVVWSSLQQPVMALYGILDGELCWNLVGCWRELQTTTEYLEFTFYFLILTFLFCIS